ncbi:hypothetical protein ACFS5N_13815 [Mucilaginibacter ximonensis]|uniref:Uncharacterized protein n=1 Tax=Mucilaginibacter ximonensis TaxID=538021 RepID=A0ABW5YFD1_9SPHI
MKLYYYLGLVCLFAFSSCSNRTDKQKNNTSAQSPGAKPRIDTGIMVKDTFFISRTTDTTGQVVHAIYIDPNRNSPAYDQIFPWSNGDSANLKNYLTQLKKGKHKLIHAAVGHFPVEWRPVYRYRGKYYVYNPDDAAGNNTMYVTDSLIMPYYFGDGYTPVAIQTFKRNNSKWVTIKTTHYPDMEGVAFGDVDVYTIDEKTGLSVWVINNEGELMVPRSGANNYPLIVNYSTLQKYPELDFDNIDAKTLVNK